MDFIQAIILGIVQGLTEFFPISSTAHLRIVPELLEWEDPGTEFSAVIQLGSLIAVLLYFRKDIHKLSLATIKSIFKLNLFETTDSRIAWGIFSGTIPIVVIGLYFKEFIKNEARQLWVIGASLIILAIFLYIAERISKQDRKINELNFWQIQLIGLTQALALIPGCSRSGSTIMGGLFVGLNREASARFSFLLGLPAIFGSGLYEFNELIDNGISNVTYSNLVLGIISAFISGYITISFFLRFLQNHGTLLFVIYRILLGTLILTVFV